MSRPTLSILLILLPACSTTRAPEIPSPLGHRGPTSVSAALPHRQAAIPDMALTATVPTLFDNESSPALQAGDGSTSKVPIGVGFTLSPSMLLIGGALDMKIDERLTAGPALHIGFDNNEFLFAPFAQIKYFPLEDEGAKVQPFVQGGAGLTFLDRDNRGDDWGILLNFGGGVRYQTGENYRLGSTILFNFVPDEVVDDSFYFTWEVIQLVLTF